MTLTPPSDLPLSCPPQPRIGQPAPDFEARSTMGPIRLSGLRGRWVILFSHPADFTPVCSTEFVELARRQGDFDALDCQLLGLSVDSLFSHLAWTRALREAFGTAITFPILEDPSMAIGRAYGMIDAQSTDSAAMRATFYIDPEGVIRAHTCYPHTVGRSVAEMLRLLQALREVAAGNVTGVDVLTPQGWQPGEPRLLPPDTTTERPDWFCRTEAPAGKTA